MSFLYPFTLFYLFVHSSWAQYEANWDSLDTRPLPEWYDKAKIGIFLHWGVYSVPAFEDAWLWYHWETGYDVTVNFIQDNYPPDWTYQDFGAQFKAEFYHPEEWADLFKRAGAKYVVLTSKHHDGFTLWPSKYSYSWNAGDVGPRRDLVGDLAEAIRATDLHFGLYHSLYEWFHPLYLLDKENNFETQNFVATKVNPEMIELINNYQPEVLWSDGNWEAPDTYWNATEFLAWLYNDSPVKDTIIINDRWGTDTMCNHGDVYSCADRYNPGVLQPHKWENAFTIDLESWGFRRVMTIDDVMTIEDLLEQIVSTVSCGGNALINVGPTKEGVISPIFEERLLQMGSWLDINGEAIYETVPWNSQNDTLNSNIWYTSKDSTIYAILLEWPENNVVEINAPVELFASNSPEVTLLGNDGNLTYNVTDDTVSITLPDRATVQSQWAWTLKIVPGPRKV